MVDKRSVFLGGALLASGYAMFRALSQPGQISSIQPVSDPGLKTEEEKLMMPENVVVIALTVSTDMVYYDDNKETAIGDKLTIEQAMEKIMFIVSKYKGYPIEVRIILPYLEGNKPMFKQSFFEQVVSSLVRFGNKITVTNQNKVAILRPEEEVTGVEA